MTERGRVFDPVAVVGHRGSGAAGVGSLPLAENSMASFEAAVRAGARWVETDARLTSDGFLVLAHDLRRSGRLVAGMTLAEAVEAGAVDARELDSLPDGIGINLEVKMSLGDAAGGGPHVAAAVFAGGRARRRPWLLSSFDPSAKAAADVHGVPFALVTRGDLFLYESVVVAARLGAAAMVVHSAALWREDTDHPTREQCLDQARRAGLETMVYWADGQTVRHAKGLGLDAVCVDDVAAAVRSMTRPVSVPVPRQPGAGEHSPILL